MTNVRITLELTAAEAWFLSDKADQAGMRLADWIHAVVLAGHAQSLTTRERVRILHAAGLSDGQISQRINATRLVVSQHRRSLGLAPRKPRYQTVTKTS